jgi:hypothetical protein
LAETIFSHAEEKARKSSFFEKNKISSFLEKEQIKPKRCNWGKIL